MQCALEVTDSSLQRTSHTPYNKSFCQTIGRCLTKVQLVKEPVSAHPHNRESALTIPPLEHYTYRTPAPLSPDIQEVKVSSLASGARGSEDLELLSAHQRILYWSGQSNERSMHDQADSSKPDVSGKPYVGNTLGQSRHKKNVCDKLTQIPPRHVVAKKSSKPVIATLSSDANVLHCQDSSPRSCINRGTKKRKLYGRATHKKLKLASQHTCEENTYSASPVEVLPVNLLADKLSETTFSTRLLEDAHLGKYGAENNDYVECGTTLNLPMLRTDGVDGSECTSSSNDVTGESSHYLTYLYNGSNTIHASKFNGSTFTEHGLLEENNVYQKLLCARTCNPETADTFFSRLGNDNSEKHNVDLEARSHTRLNEMSIECHSIGSQPKATHAEDTNGYFSCSSCCSRAVTDSSSHMERVQCSSETCSSKTSLQFNSGRNSRKSRKIPNCSDSTMSNRVVIANRHNNGGKDSSAVWQKVEKSDKNVSKRGEHTNDSLIQYRAQEDTNKGIQQDTTRHRAKRKKNKKACKQEVLNFEMKSTEEDDAFNSFQTSSKPIYKKQVPFLHQQRSLSLRQGSQSLKNYYAPKNDISKVSKDYSQQEDLPPLQQQVKVKDTSDTSTLSSCSDEFILTGVNRNCKDEEKESIQYGTEKAHNFVPDLVHKAASWSSKNLYTDPCAAEREETECAKLALDNNPQESCKLYSPSGHFSQKWVPVGKREVSNVIHLDVSDISAVEGSVPASDIYDSVGCASTATEDIKSAGELTSKLKSNEYIDLKWPTYKGNQTNYKKITEAISDVYIAWQRVEDTQLRIGRPLADFERFTYSASPVLHCTPCPTSCKSYSQEFAKNGLCLHQTSDITLRSVWQWYEEPGCYGLEVKAQDFHISEGLWNRQCPFTTYFVPYLSAVQLFRQPKRLIGGSIDKEAVDMDMTRETSPRLNPPPIFAKLMPQQSKPRNRSSTLHTEGDLQSSGAELIFEYFESEQPYSRRQLFDKVNELIAGVKPLNCHISGDPKNLELSLQDLHPTSWYCVAWYPIYRIPDGKFQAAFLTYHSLGHWIHRSSSADQAGQTPVATPVIGMQSYNDKAEWWYRMSKFDFEDVELAESSEVLKERLRTLTEAAGMMSRAEVLHQNGQLGRNRHPDYEFFLSRSCPS